MASLRLPLALLLIAAVLQGCSGSGGGETTDEQTFSELLAEYQSREAEINMSSSFSAMNLPTTGGARYEGPFLMRTSSPTIELWGQMHLDINFMTDKVNGGVENFRRPDETPVSGSLTLQEDDILRTQSTPLTASFADARLTEPGVTYDVENLQITGRFFGATGQLMTGIVTGDVV